MRNDFEEAYWLYVKDTRSQFCAFDPNDEIFLQGTRDSLPLKQDHAYVTYETWRCNDATK
jgi:hypothetical protein